jgi:hypothetical protein
VVVLLAHAPRRVVDAKSNKQTVFFMVLKLLFDARSLGTFEKTCYKNF